MTTTINGTLFRTQFNAATIPIATAETILDGGINLLNTFGAGIDNLTGGAGSKTGSYTSKQTGAIMTMAQQIYSKHYENAENKSSTTIGGIGYSYSSNTELLSFAEKLAEKIKGGTRLAFVVAEDTSGLT